MSSKQSVFESTASYYQTSSKKWMSGTFIMDGNSLHFQAEGDNKEHNLHLPLNTVSDLKKRQSNFIYPAVVISVGSENHWFTSFQNRDSAYNLLELFWREALLSKPNKLISSRPKEASTALGKELLSILQESEVNLVNAANVLSSQGRQLEESQMVLEDINSDLNMSEKLLNNMSFTQAILNIGESDYKTLIEEKRVQREEPRQKHYKVTFSEKGGDIDQYIKGTLVIGDQVVVNDDHQDTQLSINNHEVEKILIISPWAFTLEYSSEWTTKTCHFICPQLSALFKFLKVVPSLKDKIVLESENSSCDTAACSSGISSGQTPSSPFLNLRSIDAPNLNAEQMHIQDNDSVIATEDMEEISKALNNLQALATEVSREQKEQMEKINDLIYDVESTELRINQSNKDIKKSM